MGFELTRLAIRRPMYSYEFDHKYTMAAIALDVLLAISFGINCSSWIEPLPQLRVYHI